MQLTSPATMTEAGIVVKIGGSTLGAHDTTLMDLVSLQAGGRIPVVVHGGGAEITRWLNIHGLASRFVRGLRVTDPESLAVVTAVLAGLVNKGLVAALQALGGRAAGISGVDGATVAGTVRDPELGMVGEITSIDLTLVKAVRAAGFIPVLSTVGYGVAPAPEAVATDPPILNFNADTVAGEVAAALGARTLVFLTDVQGVQDPENKVIGEMTAQQAQRLIAEGTASGGMIPKLEACIRACSAGAESWIIDGRVQHALLTVLSASPIGTRVR